MSLAAWVALHGYVSVAGLLFISALGLPLPVGLALMLGGAAAHSHRGRGKDRLQYPPFRQANRISPWRPTRPRSIYPGKNGNGPLDRGGGG